MARKPRVPKAPRIGGGGRKRGPLSVETKMKIARSLARVKGDTTDWDPYEKKGRAPGKGRGSSGAGKKAARMTTTTSKGGAKVTSGIDKRTGNKVTVSKTSGTAGKNRKNAKATANPFGDFPDNTVKGGGHQASKEYLTPDNIRTEPGFRSDLQAVADRLTTPAKAEKYLDRLDDRMVRAMEDTGSPAKNRHNQRAAIHNYTQARELGLIDAELNRTGRKPVMPSKDNLPDVKAGDPEGNAKRAKGINAPVAGGKGKQAPKMKATAGKRKPATVKGEKAAEKPAKAAKPAKTTAKANKGNKGAKNANTKPAKHPKVHGTYTPEEQAAERANPGRKGGIIDREAENLTPRQLNRLARYYGLDNEQKINQLGVDKGNKKFRHTPEFEKSYDKWLAKTVAPALDTLDPDGRVDRNNPDAVLEALGVGRKDGVDTRRALTSPIYFQTLSDDVRAAIAEHVGFVPSPVNMQRTNRGEKRPAVFAEAFTIQHRRQKAGELPKFAEDKKPVKRPKGKRKTTTPAKPGPKRVAKPTQRAQEPQAKPNKMPVLKNRLGDGSSINGDLDLISQLKTINDNDLIDEYRSHKAMARYMDKQEKPFRDRKWERDSYAIGDELKRRGYKLNRLPKEPVGTNNDRNPTPQAAKPTAPAKPAEKRNNGITYRPADGDNMPAVGNHEGVTAKGTYITRPDGSQVRGDVKPVKVDTDPDRADRYDTAGRYAQITSDGKHLIVANNESELDTMLRDYTNSRGEVGKLVADNGEAPERDLGLSDWKNGNRDRTYVNKWHEPAGFEFETYKNSGRPSWATIDGKGISNTRADKLRGGKVWVDNKTGELHVEAGNDELPADKIAERLIPELERQLGHPVTYKPKNGGNKPDVKPDAKPNAEAEKVANAEAAKAETIAALTPYLAAEPRRLADTPETINDPVQKAVDKAKAPERVAESVVDNRDMADRLLDLATARSRDVTLPMITGVNFDVNDGEATIAATDRFRLATERVKIDAPNGKHLVDGDDFQAAMRAMKGVEGDFKLTDNDDGTYTLTRGDVSRNLKGIDGEFPKVAPFMERVTEETPRFTVNAPALRKVALEAKRNSTRYGGLYFKPMDGKDAYHVSWTDKYGDARTVDVPAKFSNDNPADRPAFAVNPDYLAKTLGGVKGNVTVGNDNRDRPLRIVTDGEEQPTRLLMPIRRDRPDMVAEPGKNNAARHHLNALYDALAAPKENRVAYNAKELRAAIKNAYEQATKDVKEGTPEYFLHATPDGRMRIVAGNKKSGVKVYGEVAIEPGQAEVFAILPSRNAKGAPAKPGTLNAPFKGDNGVFTVHEGQYALNHTEHGTTGQMNYVVGKESLQRTRTNLRKFGYNPDQGDRNDGMSALPGLNDVSKFNSDAAVKRAEKMEADRTRRELAEVGMTDAEKQTATAKRDNMPRLDGQNGLQAKAGDEERTIAAEAVKSGHFTPAQFEKYAAARDKRTGAAGRKPLDGDDEWGALRDIAETANNAPEEATLPEADLKVRYSKGDVKPGHVKAGQEVGTPYGNLTVKRTGANGVITTVPGGSVQDDAALVWPYGALTMESSQLEYRDALNGFTKLSTDKDFRLPKGDYPSYNIRPGDRSYTTAELKERGWKPADMKKLGKDSMDKYRWAIGHVDGHETSGKYTHGGMNVNRYQAQRVEAYERDHAEKNLGPHRATPMPTADGLKFERKVNRRTGRPRFEVTNLSDITNDPELYTAWVDTNGEVNIVNNERGELTTGRNADSEEGKRIAGVIEERLKGNTTTGGAKLDGQNGLNATTPETARRNKLSGNGAPLDAETGYQERGRWVAQTMEAMISRDGDSQARYSTVKADGTRDYSPERLVKHAEIINRLIAEAEADGPVPRDRKALFTGGIGGSGKGATLKERNKGEGTKYLTLNADDVKEVMAEMGMIEVPDNMAPMEGVALIHEESSDITSALADRAYKQGMNVVWDITMGSTGSVQKRIDELRENGYDEIVGTFTDVPLEMSVNGAAQRYARGMDKFIDGNGYGGRYVPEGVIRKAETETPGVTRNKQVFNSLRDQFDSWEVWDNNRYNESGDRQPPLMVDSGTAPERNQNDSARRLPSGQRNNGGGQGRGGATAARNDQAEATVQAAGSERPEVDSLINLQGSDSRTIDRGANVGGNARDTGVNQRRAADMTEAERNTVIVAMNNRLLDGKIDAEEYERTVWDMEHPDGPDYDNRPTPDEGAGDALHHISNPDARIQITHTEEEGTLVRGTSRDDKVGPAMRANGFKWSRNLKAWYAPRSRDKRPNSYKISRLHQALKDQGLDVGLDVDRRMGDAQRREDRRDQRSADRIAALGEKVQRKQAAANAAWNTHFSRVDELPPDGEPIKVGHHSEKRHRRALDNAWKSLGRAVDAGKAVEDAQYRMEAAERSRRSRNRPQTVANRIEKLEKQIKKSRDQLNGAPAYKGGAPRAPLTGDRRIRALNAIDADMQDLNLQRAIFEQLKADGKVVDIHDLNPGDKVKLYGEWVPVVKVNKTTASMANGWKLKQGEATVVKRATDAEREALDKAKKAQQKKSANGPHIVGEPIRKHHALTDGSETFNRGKITRNGFTIKSTRGMYDGAYGGMFEVTPPRDKGFYVAWPSALPRAKSLDEAREIIDRADADLTIPGGRLSHNNYIGSPDRDLFEAVMRPHGDPMGYARDILAGREQQGRLTYPDMWQAVAYQNGDFLRMNFGELEALANGGGERAEAAKKYLTGRFPGQFNYTTGDTAGALEFPELQLMSSAQLETIAAGTGAKATAAQQLLNDRR